MNKKAIITGANGQLGQHLIKYLLDKNRESLTVIGTIRHKSYDDQPYIFDKSKVVFELMDLTDAHSIENLILKYKPDYFINCAANAFVGESWAVPSQHIIQNTLGVLNQLEAIRKHSPLTRYFNLGTSEEFAVCGKTGPQNENTKISPRSPYGCSKAAARYLVDVYRESYGLYAIQGWTFNFESCLRGEKYVTRKITKGVARIKKALDAKKDFEPIELGNIESSRSWQHALDVADGIWRQLNQEEYRNYFDIMAWPGEHYVYHDANGKAMSYENLASRYIKPYVLSESDTHTVKEFVELAFQTAGIKGKWWNPTGEPEDEHFILCQDNGLATKKRVDLVIINPKFYRPLDVTFLYGDSTAAKKELGWEPKISFEEIVKEMVDWDINSV